MEIRYSGSVRRFREVIRSTKLLCLRGGTVAHDPIRRQWFQRTLRGAEQQSIRDVITGGRARNNVVDLGVYRRRRQRRGRTINTLRPDGDIA